MKTHRVLTLSNSCKPHLAFNKFCCILLTRPFSRSQLYFNRLGETPLKDFFINSSSSTSVIFIASSFFSVAAVTFGSTRASLFKVEQSMSSNPWISTTSLFSCAISSGALRQLRMALCRAWAQAVDADKMVNALAATDNGSAIACFNDDLARLKFGMMEKQSRGCGSTSVLREAQSGSSGLC